MSGGAKAMAILGGVTFGGYLLMKFLTPDKETIMKRLPAEMTSEKRLKEIELENEKIFASLKRTMNSNEPIWKLEKDLQPSDKK